MLMEAPNKEFVLAGNLEELKAKGRLVLHGSHLPILIIYDHGRIEWGSGKVINSSGINKQHRKTY
jgi:hypothetical protein